MFINLGSRGYFLPQPTFFTVGAAPFTVTVHRIIFVFDPIAILLSESNEGWVSLLFKMVKPGKQIVGSIVGRGEARTISTCLSQREPHHLHQAKDLAYV
jgi:hypothetical protein